MGPSVHHHPTMFATSHLAVPSASRHYLSHGSLNRHPACYIDATPYCRSSDSLVHCRPSVSKGVVPRFTLSTRSEEIHLRALMRSAAQRHAEVEHCSRGAALRQSDLYAAFSGRSPHKTQPHRNLAGSSIASVEHQRSENTS
jgi:hypothetical protein